MCKGENVFLALGAIPHESHNFAFYFFKDLPQSFDTSLKLYKYIQGVQSLRLDMPQTVLRWGLK